MLRKCSAVYGEEMWPCTDLQRTRWAIINCSGPVKLLLERSDAPEMPTWYHRGREGIATSNSQFTQLPVRLGVRPPFGNEPFDGFHGSGRPLMVAFNKCSQPVSQVGGWHLFTWQLEKHGTHVGHVRAQVAGGCRMRLGAPLTRLPSCSHSGVRACRHRQPRSGCYRA